MALATHAAGVSVQSGTIPVERLWASLLDMLPGAARDMSESWFALVADLSFLRFNFRHFHHRLIPTWF